MSLQNNQRRGTTESRTNISRMAAYSGLNSNKGDKTILNPAELSLKCEINTLLNRKRPRAIVTVPTDIQGRTLQRGAAEKKARK